MHISFKKIFILVGFFLTKENRKKIEIFTLFCTKTAIVICQGSVAYSKSK